VLTDYLHADHDATGAFVAGLDIMHVTICADRMMLKERLWIDSDARLISFP